MISKPWSASAIPGRPERPSAQRWEPTRTGNWCWWGGWAGVSCTTCPNCLSVGLSGPPREAVEALDRQWVLVGRLVRRVAPHVPRLPVGTWGRRAEGVSGGASLTGNRCWWGWWWRSQRRRTDRQWVLVGRLVRRVAHHVPQLPVGRKGRGVLGVSMPETLLVRALRVIETPKPSSSRREPDHSHENRTRRTAGPRRGGPAVRTCQAWSEPYFGVADEPSVTAGAFSTSVYLRASDSRSMPVVFFSISSTAAWL